MPKPKEADGVLKGVVLKVDGFGNLMTNFRAEDLAPDVDGEGRDSIAGGDVIR